jgi:hypothetical protein
VTAFGVKLATVSATRGTRRAPRRNLAGGQLVARCAAGAASLLVGACSYCDENDPWRATYISAARAAVVSDGGAPLAPPHCDVETNAAVQTATEASGTVVDPDLVEIARLEVERDCYKKAESSLRTRVETPRPASTGLK